MADRQPALFRDIDIAEMKWEIETKVDKILESTSLLENGRGEFVDDIAEMKKYAEEVLVEIQKSDKFRKYKITNTHFYANYVLRTRLFLNDLTAPTWLT